MSNRRRQHEPGTRKGETRKNASEPGGGAGRFVVPALVLIVVGLVGLVGLVAWITWPQTRAPSFEDRHQAAQQDPRERVPDDPGSQPQPVVAQPKGPMVLAYDTNPVTFWWNAVPAENKATARQPDEISNIRLADYAGAQSCKKCHQKNFDAWSSHPHRFMNALANQETVKGDFSGDATIDYRGGRASFYREGDQYRMKLVRGNSQRTYSILRTIGSRFFQYYAGRLISGDMPKSHPGRVVDQVLPFGYWLDQKQWVPLVHIGGHDGPDERRLDPFESLDWVYYDKVCAGCHTTRPVGDWMVQQDGRARLHEYTPRSFSYSAGAYLDEVHRQILSPAKSISEVPENYLGRVLGILDRLPAKEFAANLGVSCEACHYGLKFHVENPKIPPRFFPSSPHVLLGKDKSEKELFGRTTENVNWACARCHTGQRTYFAGGMSTWNSTEYSDAAKGHCYTVAKDGKGPTKSLTCIHCHDPHEAIGKKWKPSPREDDQSCIECHQQYKSNEAIAAHTHHKVDSAGSRCMNCHMPKVNEGMQDVVRTHLIFSPTEPKTLRRNHPNACNLCHLDKNVDWTIDRLAEWYSLDKATISEASLKANYLKRNEPVGLGWLASEHHPTRLVAAEALTKANARWALPALIDTLDDPYLETRQFTQKGLEEMLGRRLSDFGYRFWLMKDERQVPLMRMRNELLKKAAARN